MTTVQATTAIPGSALPFGKGTVSYRVTCKNQFWTSFLNLNRQVESRQSRHKIEIELNKIPGIESFSSQLFHKDMKLHTYGLCSAKNKHPIVTPID